MYYWTMAQREKSAFSTWLETNYLDWQKKRGGRVLQIEFAEWLGISKQLLSQYLNGRSSPTEERIDQLAEKLGPEVYDVLGLRRPDKQLDELLRIYNAATPEQKDEIIRQALRVAGYELDERE